MMQRVQCRRCDAQRDLARSPVCLVCGTESFVPVAPTAGDLASSGAALIDVAELIDTALEQGDVICAGHPLAEQLAEACRQRARAAAGTVHHIVGVQHQ